MPRIGVVLWISRIPYRLAPTTNASLIFYNNRLTQRRSHSIKPEFEYNRDLVFHFLNNHGVTPDSAVARPYLQFPKEEVRQLRKDFMASKGIPGDQRLIFIHTGSGGSAHNLSLEQYVKLGRTIAGQANCTLVLTAGPGERDNALAVVETLRAESYPAVLYHSDKGLIHFARHLAFADVFISGSTGPLHIAGALNRPTVGFYSRRRVSSSLRWQTLNAPDRRLYFHPPEDTEETDMDGIDMEFAGQEIIRMFL
ncbi:MAG: glycosyltransferase family 9 protein [Calditrichota bacterium]